MKQPIEPEKLRALTLEREGTMVNFFLEQQARVQLDMPDSHAVGIDEVGLGSWAGPMVVAGVSLSEREPWPDWYDDIDDSKKCSPQKRNRLRRLICDNAKFTWLELRWPAEIDRLGLGACHRDAIYTVYREACLEGYTLAIVDGRTLSNKPLGLTFTSKADRASLNVAAASIVAKVARDIFMVQIDALYPGYKFCDNKGYGTVKHQAALAKLGIIPFHRRSFKPIRDIIMAGALHES